MLALVVSLFSCGFYLLVKYFKTRRKNFLISGIMTLVISFFITVFARMIFFPGGGLHDPNYQIAKVQILFLQEKLQLFKSDCGRFPTTSEGLNLLIKKSESLKCSRYKVGGYMPIDTVPLDPYDKAFSYYSDGSTYKIFSVDDYVKIKVIGTDVKKAELEGI